MPYFLSVFRTLQNPKYWSAAVAMVARFAVLRPALCGTIPHFSSTLSKPYFLCLARSIFFKSQFFVLKLHNKHVVFSNKGTYSTPRVLLFSHISYTRHAVSQQLLGWQEQCSTYFRPIQLSTWAGRQTRNVPLFR